MGYTDFHCHLDSGEFNGKRGEIIKSIDDSGVNTVVSVADPYETGSHETTKQIIDENDNYFMMTAAHPHNAKDYNGDIEQKIFSLAEHKRTIGIGEAGLDFHYNLSPPDIQKNVFRRQIDIARELRLPLILHSRNAEQMIIKMLEEAKFDLPVVFHCYTGNIADAEEIILKGYFISISGIVTFKNAGYLRDIVRMIPLDRIFSETDSPYLSPEPFRGRTNDPSRVKVVADKIAEIKGVPVEELNKAIKLNFELIRRSGN